MAHHLQAPGRAPALEVRGLSFRYRADTVELFRGLDLTFAPGELTVLTGPSGCGKSTLLYLLGLMLRPRAGDVVVAGTSTSRATDAERSAVRARQIGFVFQDSALDPARTALDAVVEPSLYAGSRRRESHSQAHGLLDRFGVGPLAHSKPGQISGGQAQRIALARSLINEPAIILADEPTGNLDRANATSVITALKDVARTGRTVVLATHDPFVLADADAVVAL